MQKPLSNQPTNESEVATNAAGGGAIAGIGVGSAGEPGKLPKKRRILKRFRDVVKRD